MKVLRSALLISSLLAASVPARAQTDNFLAVGGQVTMRNPADGRAAGNSDIGVTWRFGHGGSGWGWQWALNWFSIDLDDATPGGRVDLAEVHVKPLMVGYGYTHAIRGMSVEANLLGGYALTSLTTTASGADRFRGTIANTFVVRPEIVVWYDLTRRVGVTTNAGYTFARPIARLDAAGGAPVRIRADLFSV